MSEDQQKEIIIFNPIYSLDSILFDSMTILAKKFLDEAVKRDDVIIRVLTPSDESKHRVSFRELYKDNKNIEFVDVDYDDFTELPLGNVNKSFKKLQRMDDYYVIFNMQNIASFGLQKIASKSFLFRPTVINWFVSGDIGEPHFQSLLSTIHETVSSVYFFPTIFNSQFSYDRFGKLVKETFSPSRYNEFIKKSQVVNLGIDVNGLDKIKENKDTEKKGFNFIYGGRPATHKRLDLMIDIVDKLRCRFDDIGLDLFITKSERISAGGYDEIKKGSYIREYLNLSQNNFFEQCLKSKAFLVTSEAESYGLAFKEMLYLGLVGIVIKSRWTDKLWWSDYPFLVNNTEEAFNTCSWVYQNYEEAVKKMEPFVKDIRENHNSSKNMNLILDYLVTTSRNRRLKIKS